MAKPKINVIRPSRDADHYSKRGVPYWWSPEWIRGTSADIKRDNYNDIVKSGQHNHLIPTNSGDYILPCSNYGRIHAVKKNGDVELYMKSKDGNLTYIQGSIQKEFKRWHEDRSIDYLLLGMDPDEILSEE